jgi:Cu+-exporting ATPase
VVVVTKSMENKIVKKSIMWGLMSAAILLSVYFIIVGFVSGIKFAGSQFSEFWYFIVSLSFGFGIQVGLYSYLRGMIKNHMMSGEGTGKTVAITGTTSTLSMVSCCSHYLINILPMLGVAGVLSFIGQYQKEIFGVGLLFNLFGIFYISRQIIRFKKQI